MSNFCVKGSDNRGQELKAFSIQFTLARHKQSSAEHKPNPSLDRNSGRVVHQLKGESDAYWSDFL